MNENKEKEYSPIYKIIDSLCKKYGISVTKLCTNVTGSKGNLPTWQKGSINAHSLIKIADYFDCSVDYLLGRSDSPKSEISIKQNDNHGLNMGIIEYSPAFSVSMQDEQQQEISKMLSDMSLRERTKLMNMIYDFHDECEKRNE